MYGNTPEGGSPYSPPTRGGPSDRAKRLFRRLAVLAAIVIVAAIVLSGSLYTINSGEEAVITRWGKYVGTISEPGLQFKAPFVDAKAIVDVEGIKRLEFGGRTLSSGAFEDKPEEAIMLTREENLVLADWVVQYRIDNSYAYLFNVEDPESTLRIIAESSYRRVTAAHSLDDILTNQKESMQSEITEDLQAICNKYQMGVRIMAVQLQDASPPDEVKGAFLDVTNAIEDKNATINEASKYENEQLPQARGQAQALINEAEGYKTKRINDAEGAVARYLAIEGEYSSQPDVMRMRLYMEMIRDVLPRVSHIYFVDAEGNTLNFLPLDGSQVVQP